MDRFAEIAKKGIGGRGDLISPAPRQFHRKDILLQNCGNFQKPEPLRGADTPAGLKEELTRMRAQYAPFLRKLAPAAEDTRTVIPLKEFFWHQEGAEDSAPVRVTIPHYGAPLGAVSCVYETDFLCEVPDGKHAFLVVTGADYRARVFVNDRFAGMHEGFFARFEFDVTKLLYRGRNQLRIELDNDYTCMGSRSENDPARYYGDKIYAATGPGYDEPLLGWHHCPPGMGLYDKVFLEIRGSIAVTDIFTRTLENEIEVWTELTGCGYPLQKVYLDVSLYGENHEQTVLQHLLIEPSTSRSIGLGDTFTEVAARRENTLGIELPLLCGKGRNLFKFRIPRKGLKLWQPDAPYLYQLQISALDENRKVLDTLCRNFGVRTFTQDLDSDPKGMFYLNGEKIRLRGANTMGFEQQDVMTGNYDQLLDDMLLAKICNMNFLRLTQRPVQQEIYDMCDRVGLLTQTDLPLFAVLRRHLFCEAVRQAEEMERHVRRHPCNVLVTYINEPSPNADNQPGMSLTRPELELFFEAADIVVRLQNPDRVIKHADGDYDPPTTTLPDSHCYPMWYNGHGIDIGKLHKGYWMPVKPGWYYGCGEFGCEGLEDEAAMRAHYPAEWLPWSAEEDAKWRPSRIPNAQTDSFYHFFYEEQHSLSDWVKESQRFQAFATRMMTEAFRRDARMVSFAIHLFIDAFPSGWMKAVMDCGRRPKPAYFAYRKALAPVLLSLRTDRFAYQGGEQMAVEGWICNDTAASGNCTVEWYLYQDGKPYACAANEAEILPADVNYGGTASIGLPEVKVRQTFTLQACLKQQEKVIAQNDLQFEVYPAAELPPLDTVFLIRKPEEIEPDDLQAVQSGAYLWVDEPESGTYAVGDSTIQVEESGMAPMHFASRDTGHPWAADFKPYDFCYWYDSAEDCITPLAACTFRGGDFTPVLVSRNLDKNGNWSPVMLLGERKFGKGRIIVSQIGLRHMMENPAGCTLLLKILKDAEKER